MPEERGADRAREERDGERRQRLKRRRRRVGCREEQPGKDEYRGRRVNIEVEELDGRADQAREEHLARRIETDVRRGGLGSHAAAIVARPCVTVLPSARAAAFCRAGAYGRSSSARRTWRTLPVPPSAASPLPNVLHERRSGTSSLPRSMGSAPGTAVHEAAAEFDVPRRRVDGEPCERGGRFCVPRRGLARFPGARRRFVARRERPSRVSAPRLVQRPLHEAVATGGRAE